MKEKVLQIIAEQLNMEPEDLEPEMDFVDDLNQDSIELVELIMSLEDEFGIEVDEEKLEQVRTVGDVLDLVEELDI
ncbi:acyl carrier protein [Aedoeadaptatus coxii]|uniref:Acyl carrier protein n=1 Tax=Aedoeadaptatus coxii TaxID=755172 RepID=A0A134ABA5_9FIRM|nr:acyl carrier protein [Peptoniphilus coxii]KXB65002.1 acyl carrier protein [Peptoniphilus coxii]CAC9930564.1 acyl carrier protein [Peptoniphilus coxii]